MIAISLAFIGITHRR
nr:hypothetical protein [Haloquadratum walsbyi]